MANDLMTPKEAYKRIGEAYWWAFYDQVGKDQPGPPETPCKTSVSAVHYASFVITKRWAQKAQYG